ncbi:type I DNA topoisomerase [Candidatus Saganbacteria bacterium]|nr:type I DNA topoisomerase [Candidatus Saganbacteria bacterium]
MAKKQKNLVIVESPAKARTLEKFLGPDFVVTASGGHIRDLPPKSLGVKIEDNFAPNYKIIKGKEKTVDDLKKAAAKAAVVYLAPDPDREGEAIAWHLKALLDKKTKVKRIEFHEITKDAVTSAVKHPRDIDMARVNAQQARRILDRLVGYKLSPLLWRKIRKGLSAGRVQSVTVRLICEREEEINKFNKEEYWDIIAQLATDQKIEFKAKLAAKGDELLGVRPADKGKVIISQTEADAILQALQGAAYKVAAVRKKEQTRYPSPPFITSTLQQEASRKLGYTARRTMSIAQKLYEGIDLAGEGRHGLITYMRTDSVRLAVEAETAVRQYINESFGANYLPAKPLQYKVKKQAQDAHEAIRPTSVLRHPDKIKDDLKPEEFKLYELIWKRFVACQMNPAVYDQTSVDISAADYIFRATGSIVKFDGFMKLYLESADEETNESAERILPALTENEILSLIKLNPEQHFTQPPPRYNEASLVKELEKRGIGRPSTYAPIISTIQDRGYVTKEGKALKPTEIGIITNGLLVKHFPRIMDIEFTAKMEDDLDEVADDEITWTKVLKNFYAPFAAALAEADVKMEKVKKEIATNELCPECGKPIIIRSGRYGDFMACSAYPNCKYTKDIAGEGGERQLEEICEKCGSKMGMKHGRYGAFLACSGYPKCKNIKSILKKIGTPCPQCGGEIVERRTRKHRIFYGCSNYPKCDYATWQRPGSGKEKA